MRALKMFNSKTSLRTVYVICCIMLISMLLMLSLIHDHYVHHTRWYESPAPCVTPKLVIQEMANLTFVVSDVLNSFKVPHVLCYGTLWGALRTGKILPWDNNVDLCVMREDLYKAPWSEVMTAMHSRGLETSYDHRHGELTIRRNSAVCVITVFYVTYWKQVYRDGWEHRYLFLFQGSSVSFPKDLLKAPLPTISFHGRPGMPVPRDDMELLKYLYSDDWWIEKPPLGCKGIS